MKYNLKDIMFKKISYLTSVVYMLSVLSLGLLSASTAAASGVDLGSAVGVSGSSSEGVLNANLGSSLQTSSSVGVNSNQNASTSTTDQSQSSASVSSNGSVAADLGAGIVVTRSDADADSSEPTIAAANVSSSGDLNSFVKSEMKADANLGSVGVDSNSVNVNYKEQAKLFGFIPMKTSVTVTVDNSGNVTLHYPWYRFLMSVDDSNLKTNLQSNAAAAMSANANVNSTASLSTKAEVVEAVVNTLRANLNGNVSANASASTQTSASAY